MAPDDDPLWISLPALDPLSDADHGKHQIEFVSRHSIAETGLICPVCGTEVAPLGDYRLVRHSRLGDVVQCNGKREMSDGNERVCGMFLAASPDTEHGDHILYDKVPKEERKMFYEFVRISEGDAARRKYGEDIIMKDGELAAVMQAQKPAHKYPKLDFKTGQVWQTTDGRIVQITRMHGESIPAIPHTGFMRIIATVASWFGVVLVKKPAIKMHFDPVFQGWGHCRFQTEEFFEWYVDATGLIRQSMTDPTITDKIRLTTEVRPN
jgi:hypothetical protein